MRAFLMTTAMVMLAQAAMAETFTLSSEVDRVTAYPQGAKVTRSVGFDVPAGQHRILIGDIPSGFNAETLQVYGGDGLVVGAVSFRDDRLPPDDREVAAREAVQGEIDALRDKIRGRVNDKAAQELVIDAAKARIEFLETLGGQQAKDVALGAEAPSVETLLQMVELVGAQTLLAMQDAQAAREVIYGIDRDIDDMQDDLVKLRQKLEAVALPLADRVIVSLDISAESAAAGDLQISYVTFGAGWSPVYDVRLDQVAEEVTIERQVALFQQTGETWENVQMTVSTARPNLRLNPGELRPQLAYLFDPQIVTRDREVGSLAMAAPVVMEMVAEDSFASRKTAAVDFQGLTAIYHLPDAIRLDGDGATVLFALDETSFDVEVTARATPFLDSNAYLYAEFKNDSAAPFLPGDARLYRDGAFIGQTGQFPMIAAGQSVDLAFGAIDGITTERVTLSRETGDSGVFTSSNDKDERYELKVENLTGAAWDVVLYDRMPYSEQEDLEIELDARPAPTDVNVDGKRGVLGWTFNLPAGDEKSVSFSYALGWPKGQELGYR